MSTIKITGGLDVGNGYTKVALRASGTGAKTDPDRFDIPSSVALATSAADLTLPDSVAAKEVENDFFNALDATFTSPLVKTTHRHLFGRRGIESATSRSLVFDVKSTRSKAEQELSSVLVLGVVAGQALRALVRAKGALPDGQITAKASLVLALPIDEFREHRYAFAEGFTRAPHIVTIHNFETPVSIKVVFENVQVVAEGSSGQFAIRELGLGLAEQMLADVRKRGAELPGVTGQAVYDASSTLSIDIGEGTVNFAVYSHGKFNVDASRTFPQGYGNVLQSALQTLAREKIPFRNRRELAEYLLAPVSPMKQAEHDQVAAIVREHAQLFAEQVAEETGQLFAEIGRSTEVVYVFGGGSAPLREVLHPALLEVVGSSAPVLYLDASYSRHLNRQGLLIAGDKVFGK